MQYHDEGSNYARQTSHDRDEGACGFKKVSEFLRNWVEERMTSLWSYSEAHRAAWRQSALDPPSNLVF